MGIPIEIVFRDIPLPKEPLEEEVRKRAERLERYYAGVLNCRVVVESPHRHHREGNVYMVKIDVAVPGKVIVVDREHRGRREHQDVYVAIRDAFDAAARRLEEHARVEHRDVKAHQSEPRGVVSKLFPHEGYGFIEGFGGREIYFHRNSVLDGFEELEVGAEVRFEEEEGEEGPQASTVKILRKPLHG